MKLSKKSRQSHLAGIALYEQKHRDNALTNNQQTTTTTTTTTASAAAAAAAVAAVVQISSPNKISGTPNSSKTSPKKKIGINQPDTGHHNVSNTSQISKPFTSGRSFETPVKNHHHLHHHRLLPQLVKDNKNLSFQSIDIHHLHDPINMDSRTSTPVVKPLNTTTRSPSLTTVDDDDAYPVTFSSSPSKKLLPNPEISRKNSPNKSLVSQKSSSHSYRALLSSSSPTNKQHHCDDTTLAESSAAAASKEAALDLNFLNKNEQALAIGSANAALKEEPEPKSLKLPKKLEKSKRNTPTDTTDVNHPKPSPVSSQYTLAKYTKKNNSPTVSPGNDDSVKSLKAAKLAAFRSATRGHKSNNSVKETQAEPDMVDLGSGLTMDWKTINVIAQKRVNPTLATMDAEIKKKKDEKEASIKDKAKETNKHKMVAGTEKISQEPKRESTESEDKKEKEIGPDKSTNGRLGFLKRRIHHIKKEKNKEIESKKGEKKKNVEIEEEKEKDKEGENQENEKKETQEEIEEKDEKGDKEIPNVSKDIENVGKTGILRDSSSDANTSEIADSPNLIADPQVVSKISETGNPQHQITSNGESPEEESSEIQWLPKFSNQLDNDTVAAVKSLPLTPSDEKSGIFFDFSSGAEKEVQNDQKLANREDLSNSEDFNNKQESSNNKKLNNHDDAEEAPSASHNGTIEVPEIKKLPNTAAPLYNSSLDPGEPVMPTSGTDTTKHKTSNSPGSNSSILSDGDPRAPINSVSQIEPPELEDKYNSSYSHKDYDLKALVDQNHMLIHHLENYSINNDKSGSKKPHKSLISLQEELIRTEHQVLDNEVRELGEDHFTESPESPSKELKDRHRNLAQRRKSLVEDGKVLEGARTAIIGGSPHKNCPNQESDDAIVTEPAAARSVFNGINEKSTGEEKPVNTTHETEKQEEKRENGNKGISRNPSNESILTESKIAQGRYDPSNSEINPSIQTLRSNEGVIGQKITNNSGGASGLSENKNRRSSLLNKFGKYVARKHEKSKKVVA
ncbi:hypothetical protein DASC09_022230 [Saccharomycopsis crataegensis]|uniref:Uncharacterized protein n=1 Tax=Saccharomycopsis crataegensis TaxID=43959 RepID=A0AAV5QJE1_9ASCO|nr:hypothetical protein DASC09_022230 [Saccharomycopsis crataegensis]